VWKQRDPNTNATTKSKISVAQYMEKRWKVTLAPWELKQPLLRLTTRGEPVYLVPSRCHEASLPADFTKDAGKMKRLREHMITEPIDRYQRISSLIGNFARAEVLGEWDLKVSETFASVKTKQLYHVNVLDPRGGSNRQWQEYEGRRMVHTQPMMLEANCWAVVYNGSHYDQANILVDNMKKLCG
jgi:hypothetical protein